MKNQHYLTHSPIDVFFKQSKDDFIVTEVPMYEFSGEGEHLILKMRKKDLSTWDVIYILADFLECSSREFGYAGLKDKNAMTIQYISIHKKFEEKLQEFSHSQIKILETTYHKNKIKIGHLKGNKFFIRLKRVFPIHETQLKSVIKKIKENGIPNYFGFQRFGIEGNNYIKGQEILEGKRKEKNRKLKQMYINAYQSYLFNNWLSKRVEISKLIDGFEPKELENQLDIPLSELKDIKKQSHPFKIFLGDLLNHYPFGKLFYAEDLESESDKFILKDRVPTGLLAGKKIKKAQNTAKLYEDDIDKQLPIDGARRFAWVWAEDIEYIYRSEDRWFEMNFYLPKGSYATTLIDELLH
jgi:tRNA pseudouridine13 synthase